MKPAEFEEREYEAPLYNQLERGDPRIWAPGQVFEGHIGIDRALLLIDDWMFRLHGHPGYLPGALLPRYDWPQSWFRHRTYGRLPNFRLNLFIQAKRPYWSRRPPKILRDKGISGLFWRFNIDEHQQQALETVASRLKKRALVVYAAPVFHEHSTLFRHTRRGTIAQHSTFPSVAMLQRHEAWNYCAPGAVGVANPDPTNVNEPPLSDRIASLIEEAPESQGWRPELKTLAAEIRAALGGEELAETSRRAASFDLIREIERSANGLEEAEVITAFLTVLAFCNLYTLDWHVLDTPSP